MGRYIDITNKTYGYLTAIQPTDKYKKYWEFKCSKCGNIAVKSKQCVMYGYTTSCGCIQRQTGNKSVKWKGYGEISSNYWCRVIRSAKSRNIELNITIEDAWKQWLKQNGKCALTGWILQFALTAKKSSNATASLDRIDSSKPYTKDNIQWVHKDINRLKVNFSEEYLLKICRDIVNYVIIK